MLPLALGSLGLLAYTYAGYPVLIAALARIAPAEVRADPTYEPTVTVLLPVHDAAPYLEAKLTSLLEQDYPPDKLDVLVLSDGSTDGSDDVVRRFADRSGRVRLVRSERRLGKPAALNQLRSLATGDVLLMTDARQPLSQRAVRTLVAPLADPSVGCAGGNLVLTGAIGAGAYWRYERWIRASEARFRSMVGVSGALYALRRSDLAELPEDTILDDVWIPMRLRLEGKRIVFCPEAEAYDEAFEDEREFGRKVRTLAGNFQLFARMPELFDPRRNPSWLEIVSHKALRLACPFALATLLAASFGPARSAAARGFLRALAAGQLGFYGLAALGPRAGSPGRLARTFVVMNAAAVAGLLRFARGGQSIRW